MQQTLVVYGQRKKLARRTKRHVSFSAVNKTENENVRTRGGARDIGKKWNGTDFICQFYFYSAWNTVAARFWRVHFESFSWKRIDGIAAAVSVWKTWKYFLKRFLRTAIQKYSSNNIQSPYLFVHFQGVRKALILFMKSFIQQ